MGCNRLTAYGSIAKGSSLMCERLGSQPAIGHHEADRQFVAKSKPYRKWSLYASVNAFANWAVASGLTFRS